MSLPWSTAKEFYDLHSKALFAGRKAMYHVGLIGTAEENAAYTMRVAEIKPGDQVVDLGCGSGFMVNYLYENGAFPVGCSDSEACVQAARGNYPDRLFVVQDMATLDASEEFDVFLAMESLGYADLGKTMASVSKSLKPGGRFFVKDMIPFPSLTPEGNANLEYIRHYWKYACTPQDETIAIARKHGLYLKRFLAYDEANIDDFIETLPLLMVPQEIPFPDERYIRPCEFLFEREESVEELNLIGAIFGSDSAEGWK